MQNPQSNESQAAANAERMRAMKVWIDGEIVPGDQARISVLDHGFLYGDGLFEGIRISGGRVFRLGDHLRRFALGARALGLELPHSVDQIEKIVLDTARAFGQPEAYVRLIATRGTGALGVDPTTCFDPQLVCIVTSISLYPADKLARGIDLITSSLRRPAADVLDPQVKSLNYMNSVLAKQEARLRGADEALLLNARGMIAEAAVANVFAVQGEVLATPPVVDGALPGITRATVIELAPSLGLEPREHTLSRVDLLGADEVFLSGSGARIVAVARLDGREIGAGGGRGPVTARFDEAFGQYAAEHGVVF